MVDYSAAEVFRDFVTDGVPSSGRHNPRKAEIRAWGAGLEWRLAAALMGGGLIYDSKAGLDADLAHDENSRAEVNGDADPNNNGIYLKEGAAGEGYWVRVADLAYSFIYADNAGGSANAIVATTATAIPAKDAAVLIALPITAANTDSHVTVSFNGSEALAIRTNSGNEPAVGGLTAGMVVAGYKVGNTFHLLSDQASAAIQAAAEDAAADSQEAQIAAELARDLAAGYVNDIVTEKEVPIFATQVGMAVLSLPEGLDRVRVLGRLNILQLGASADFIRMSKADIDAAGYPALAYFRTSDRYLPGGGSDSTNGGYFVIAETVVSPLALGATFAFTDDTAAIQAACKVAVIHGGEVVVPKGTAYISLANSIHAKACILMPDGLRMRGSGEQCRILRHPAERGVNGVLMVNEGYDTAGDYDAASNIHLREFYISDGDGSASRSLGDLIAFGHAHDCTVRRMYSGNHDQHFVDCCASRDIEISDNTCTQLLSTGDSPIQLDGASSLGIWGLHLDDTPCKNIRIFGNNIIHKGINAAIQVFHAPDILYAHTYVADNVIDAGYVAGAGAIGFGGDVAGITVDSLFIKNNIVSLNHPSSRGINLAQNVLEKAIGVIVSGNRISGACRVGIYVGTNQTDADLSKLRWQDVIVDDNIVDIDATGSTGSIAYAVQIFGVKGRVSGGTYRVTRATSEQSGVVIINMARGLRFIDNEIEGVFGSPLGSGGNGAIWIIKQSNVVATELELRGNRIHGNSVNHCILYGSSANWDGTDRHLLSRNSFPTAPITSHIREIFAASDGTNGWHQVDLSSIGAVTGGSVAIAANQYYSGLPLGLKKTTNQQASPAKIELQYVPNNNDDFDNDVEEIMFVVTDTATKDCAGTQVADVDQVNGTFSILTGSVGVSAVINNTTRKAVYRTNGYLKAFASI